MPLHSFSGGAGDGANPWASVILSGSTLYGTTLGGGASNNGTVFKVGTDGTGFALIRSFAGGADDGASPFAAAVLSGSTLYGTTGSGGTLAFGTVFKVDTDGTGFALLHSFAGGADDGWDPAGSVVLSGSTLYGTTGYGGTPRIGTVFKVNTDGTGFALLRSFAGGAGDGAGPFASLALSGSTLYGTTYNGGASNNGTVFKLDTDGSGFALLHSFAGGDGAPPIASVVLSGATLYGTTGNGGASDNGTVFKVNTDGTGFALLHSFAGGAGDGANPKGSVVVSGSTLYGTTYNGGPSNNGTVFKVNTDGTGFALLDSFAGGADGANPLASVVLSGSTLYGTTGYGGALGSGTVFKIDLTCVANEHVIANSCVACAPGSTRPAGDDPTAADTICTATACAVNQYVANHTCVDCAPGGTHPAGDLATGANTACANTICAANEHVMNHACVPCAPGSTRPAGDLSTDADTHCAATECAANEHVSNHACVACAPGGTRSAGDLATGDDTGCADTLCAKNEHVASHRCIACAPGSTRPAGDAASGDDTTCEVTSCAANEHVASHACVLCPLGTTRPAGDLATGANTACSGLTGDSGARSGDDGGRSSGNDGRDSSSSAASADDASTDSGNTGSDAVAGDRGCSCTMLGSSRATATGFGPLGVLLLLGVRRRHRSSQARQL